MATLFSDDFNRADSASLGGNWSETLSTDWAIVSNAVTCPVGTNNSGIVVNTSALGTADYAVEAAITQAALVSGNNRGLGLIARYVDVNNFYLGWISEFGTDYYLYRVLGGSFTPLTGSPWTTTALSDPVTLRLECQGTTIRLFVNGTQRISVTDTNHTAEGDFGMRVFSGALFTGHRFDNILVTDFGGGGGPSQAPRSMHQRRMRAA